MFTDIQTKLTLHMDTIKTMTNRICTMNNTHILKTTDLQTQVHSTLP